MHWQLLLQARAIDSQCHVLGAAQQGWHGDKRQTWGHAAISNSLGEILVSTQEEGAQIMSTHFDLEQQKFIRNAMPLMNHRVLVEYKS